MLSKGKIEMNSNLKMNSFFYTFFLLKFTYAGIILLVKVNKNWFKWSEQIPTLYRKTKKLVDYSFTLVRFILFVKLVFGP